MPQCRDCGEEIGFEKTGELKPDGKPKYRRVNPVTGVTHVCRSKQKAAASTIATPTVLSGILLNIDHGGVVVRTEAGDRTYPLPKNYQFSPWPEMPQKIDYMLRKDGCLVIMKFNGPADVPIVENEFKTAGELIREQDLDRMNGPANGEGFDIPGGPLIAPPPQTAAVDTISASPSPATVRNWSEIPRLTIGALVNLEKYENLRVEVSGAATDGEQLKQLLDETLASFGRKNEATQEMIDAYRRRVM